MLAINDNAVYLPTALTLSRASPAPTEDRIPCWSEVCREAVNAIHLFALREQAQPPRSPPVLWEPSLLAINDNAVYLPTTLALSRASPAPTEDRILCWSEVCREAVNAIHLFALREQAQPPRSPPVLWEPSLLAINDNAVYLPTALALSRASPAPIKQNITI